MLCLCLSWAEAHIWAWMLNMPHSPPKDGAKAVRGVTPAAKATTVGFKWHYPDRDCAADAFAQPVSCEHKWTAVSLGQRFLVLASLCISSQAVCDHDRTCGRGFSCDRHFGLCVPLRGEGHYCRRDAQCVRRLSCMFGKCHRSIPNGQEGKATAGSHSSGSLSRSSTLVVFY